MGKKDSNTQTKIETVLVSNKETGIKAMLRNVKYISREQNLREILITAIVDSLTENLAVLTHSLPAI